MFRMDQLTAMRVFARVAERGSFTHAADDLQLSRAVVSHHVASLERHLGVRLLGRTTRRVTLTQDGADYLERCRRILGDLDAADEAIRHGRERPEGKLRVDVPTSFGRHLLVPALPQFLDRYPGLELDVRMNDRIVDLEAERIDLVVRVGAVDLPGLVARVIARPRMATCGSPRYLAKFGVPARPEDLEHHQLLGLLNAANGRPREWHMRVGGQDQVVKLPFRAVFDSPEAPILAAIAGGGLCHSIDLMVREAVASGSLQEVLQPYATNATPIHVVYPASQRGSAKVRVFADFAAELMQGFQRSAPVARAQRPAADHAVTGAPPGAP